MRAAPHLNGAAALAALGLIAATPDPARAAVNVCKPLHAGEHAEDRSELLAKKRALESWSNGAKLYGEEFTRWGIAWNRRLDCIRTGTGTFRCQASGHPCTVRQVPSPDLVPLPRATLPQ